MVSPTLLNNLWINQPIRRRACELLRGIAHRTDVVSPTFYRGIAHAVFVVSPTISPVSRCFAKIIPTRNTRARFNSLTKRFNAYPPHAFVDKLTPMRSAPIKALRACLSATPQDPALRPRPTAWPIYGHCYAVPKYYRLRLNNNDTPAACLWFLHADKPHAQFRKSESGAQFEVGAYMPTTVAPIAPAAFIFFFLRHPQLLLSPFTSDHSASGEGGVGDNTMPNYRGYIITNLSCTFTYNCTILILYIEHDILMNSTALVTVATLKLLAEANAITAVTLRRRSGAFEMSITTGTQTRQVALARGGIRQFKSLDQALTMIQWMGVPEFTVTL